MEHIKRKRKELEELEQLNNLMIQEAVSKAQSGGKKAQILKSIETPREEVATDYTNNYFKRNKSITSETEVKPSVQSGEGKEEPQFKMNTMKTYESSFSVLDK